MSEIKVNSIKGVGASSAAITVNNTDGTCTANLTNRTNKNLIINGAMNVAQRNVTQTGSAANGFSTVDRFAMYQSGTYGYPSTAQSDVASGTTPYTNGFRKAFKITNANQNSADAADQLYISHKIEAQDMATSGWNYTSTSSKVTLSFWVKSSVAQNFYGYLKSTDGTDQRYAYETGSLTANTWTKITKKIPGNSNLQFDNNTDQGLEIYLSQFWGTNYTDSGVSLNTWGNWSGGSRTPDYTSTWYTTNNATFQITGVQLEVGSVATDFEFRSFGQELDLCKRYFQILVRGSDGLNGYSFMGVAAAYSSVQGEVPMRWEKEMRGSPSLEVSNGTNYFTFTQTGSNAVNLSTFVAYGLNRSNGLLYQAGLSGLTTGKAYRAQTNNNSAYIYINAEL